MSPTSRSTTVSARERAASGIALLVASTFQAMSGRKTASKRPRSLALGSESLQPTASISVVLRSGGSPSLAAGHHTLQPRAAERARPKMNAMGLLRALWPSFSAVSARAIHRWNLQGPPLCYHEDRADGFGAHGAVRTGGAVASIRASGAHQIVMTSPEEVDPHCGMTWGACPRLT